MLCLKNITKSFPGNFQPTLANFNLELSEGEFCVVIGSNGSGKSTLLRTITGEYQVDKGKVLVQGQNLNKQDSSRFIATVTQDVDQGTVPELTLLENMVLTSLRGKRAGISLYAHNRLEAVKQLKQLRLGLENYIDRPLKHLSGGQRQMVATLMTISSKPSILLLDEHTSALDPKMQRQLMEFTARQVAAHRLTCLMVTHKLDDAIKYGNRLIMLHKGKIVFEVAGKKKEELTINKLLKLFHQYEDLTLTCEAAHGN